MGEGTGRSKKEAEQLAAQDALNLIESARRARQLQKTSQGEAGPGWPGSDE